MSVVVVETYVVKADRVGEFEPALEEFLRLRGSVGSGGLRGLVEMPVR